MHLEILVEEPSLEAFLRVVLPRLLGEHTSFEIYPFSGKHDLLTNIEQRFRGYSHWIDDQTKIIVLVDRDNDDCAALKDHIAELATRSGLHEKSRSAGFWNISTRIVCEELEAWYFGDWQAVRAAYPKVPENIRNKARFRHSDEILGGTWEAFEQVLQRSSYYKEGLPKIEVARSVGSFFDVHRCDSPSWRAFLGVIQGA